MALEKELETYNQKLVELLANEGKFVLIHGDQTRMRMPSKKDTASSNWPRSW